MCSCRNAYPEVPPDSRLRHEPTTSRHAPLTRLSESDLVTADGAINRSMLMRIARHRALRERQSYAAMGTPRPWSELLGEEMRHTWSIAKVMVECRKARSEFAKLTPAEQSIRQLELRLHKLRYGLATPSCAKTEDDIAHHERLLEHSRKRAATVEAAE
jgi:hypothetical protein